MKPVPPIYGEAALLGMELASTDLIRALDAQDANAILDAAQSLHYAMQRLYDKGAWHIDAPRPASSLQEKLRDIAMLIRAAEYRVRYLTDHSDQRVMALAAQRPSSSAHPRA
jgi:protein-tyrosine-phosphatase